MFDELNVEIMPVGIIKECRELHMLVQMLLNEIFKDGTNNEALLLYLNICLIVCTGESGNNRDIVLLSTPGTLSTRIFNTRLITWAEYILSIYRRIGLFSKEHWNY